MDWRTGGEGIKRVSREKSRPEKRKTALGQTFQMSSLF